MKTKLALCNTLIGALCVISCAAKADTVTPINETAPTYADRQESELIPQSSLMATPTTNYEGKKKKNFSGFYVGAGASYTHSTNKIKITIKNPLPIGPATLSAEKDLNSNDIGANLNLGYGHAWNMFYLGGEAFFDYAHMDMDVSGNQVNIAKISANYDAGAALKLGLILFDRAMLYALAGFSFSTFDTTWLNLPSESHTKVGPMIGGGFEYLFTDSWAAKLQYTFTSYGSISKNFPGIVDAKFDSIDRQALILGITYHF